MRAASKFQIPRPGQAKDCWIDGLLDKWINRAKGQRFSRCSNDPAIQ
jgi:hypothetical protein